MKVLVTGGTGFLGRHIVWRLAEEGMDVAFTGRCATAAAQVVELAPGPVEWLQIDHGTQHAADLLTDAAVGARAIIHCAALSSPWGRPGEFHKANIASTEEVLAACRKVGIHRLIHISTPSLYFRFNDRLSIREDEPLPRPVNEYARSKTMAEMLVRATPPPETVILRPRALFGPWDKTLIPRLLRVMEHGPIPLMRGGRASLDLTYIDNAVDAVWLSLTQPLPTPLACYNVTNGEPTELVSLLEKVAQAFDLPLQTRRVPWPLVDLAARLSETISRIGNGAEPLLTRYGAGVLAFSQTLDISAIRNDLGYQPRVSLAEGIRRHAEWWHTRRQRPSS